MPCHVLPRNPPFLTVKNSSGRRASRVAGLAISTVRSTVQTVIASNARMAATNPLQSRVLSTGSMPSNVCSPFFRELKDTSHSWEVFQ